MRKISRIEVNMRFRIWCNYDETIDLCYKKKVHKFAISKNGILVTDWMSDLETLLYIKTYKCYF